VSMVDSTDPPDDERALIRRLPDIEAIKQLKARYFRALDLRQWDLFASVWTVDAHLEQSLTGDVLDPLPGGLPGSLTA